MKKHFFWSILLGFIMPIFTQNQKVYVIPFSNDPMYFRKGSLFSVQARAYLATLGFDIVVVEPQKLPADGAYVISLNGHHHKESLAKLRAYQRSQKILFLYEPMTTQPRDYQPCFLNQFHKIYTWNDRLVDNKRYFKFFYSSLVPCMEPPTDFGSKKLSLLLSSRKGPYHHPEELYSERIDLITFFEKLPGNDFDLYGKGWEKYNLKNYKGFVSSKIETLRAYKFCFCYENSSTPGYVTEKIFHCFQAGCVPIYLGAENIATYIPKECFIDRRDFASHENLYAFIKNMPQAEWETYLVHIKKYLSSEQAFLYSPEHYTYLLMRSIIPHEQALAYCAPDIQTMIKTLYPKGTKLATHYTR